jgi:hypothetical protein
VCLRAENDRLRRPEHRSRLAQRFVHRLELRETHYGLVDEPFGFCHAVSLAPPSALANGLWDGGVAGGIADGSQCGLCLCGNEFEWEVFVAADDVVDRPGRWCGRFDPVDAYNERSKHGLGFQPCSPWPAQAWVP